MTFGIAFIENTEKHDAEILELAMQDRIRYCVEHGMDASFEAALNCYARLWALANGYFKPEEVAKPEAEAEDPTSGWETVDNAVQVDPIISEIRRDLNFLSRHLCVTLPSVYDDRNPATKYAKHDEDEDEDEGFRW